MHSDNDDAASVSSSRSTGSRFLPHRLSRTHSSRSMDDASVGSADSQFLPRTMFQTPPPVPKYQEANRMLMPSPLPSPLSSNRKTPFKKPTMRHSDSDSQSESSTAQHDREEAHMKRLVHMAKQQQSLKTAWFAASTGKHVVGSTALRSPSARRAPRSRLSGSSSLGGGPVDVDMVSVASGQSDPKSAPRQLSGPVDVDSMSEASIASHSSTSSSVGSRKSFIRLVFPISPSTASTKSEGSATIKISNVTTDVESAIVVTDDKCDKTTKRRRLIGWSLFCILILAVLTVVVSVIVSKGDVGNDDSTSLTSSSGGTLGRDSSFPPTIPPISSGAIWTNVPSHMPSSSLKPSATPSAWPSPLPSVAPSNVPTAAPSMAPTRSPKPSMFPTQSPTTIFSTTEFDTLLSISGEQLSEQYGHAVAVSGDASVVAIAAPNYSHNNGTLVMNKSGRVQVFERLAVSPTQWQLKGQALLGRHDMDQFGHALSLSHDGSRLAVSEPGMAGPAGDRSGNVRVFDYNKNTDENGTTVGTWILQGNEIGGEAVADLFGLSLALSGNGKRLAVGAPYHGGNDSAIKLSGRVRVFEHDKRKSQWQPLGDALDGPQTLDWFGWAVDLSFDGTALAIGAPRNTDHGGFVRCFQWTKAGKAWKQTGPDIVNNVGESIQLDDRFGMALSISDDGKRLAVASPWKDLDARIRKSGLVVVYERSDDTDWTQLGNPIVGSNANDRLGWSVSLSSLGDYLAIGIPGLSQVTFHQWTGVTWDTASLPLQTSNDALQLDDYGHAVALSSNGNAVVIGATEGSQGGAGYAQVLQQRQFV